MRRVGGLLVTDNVLWKGMAVAEFMKEHKDPVSTIGTQQKDPVSTIGTQQKDPVSTIGTEHKDSMSSISTDTGACDAASGSSGKEAERQRKLARSMVDFCECYFGSGERRMIDCDCVVSF